MELQTLSVDDIQKIHELLCEEFRKTDKPIVPEGLKSKVLLESAVGRQWTSLGGVLKYPDAISNAASLMFGICCNHPFHNGNKRSALVALLSHLERNKLSIFGTPDKELEDRIVYVAERSFATHHHPKKGHPEWASGIDGELDAIIDWLGKRVQRVRRGERPITYRELTRILAKFGFALENPRGNHIDIVKYDKKTVGIFRREQRLERRHIRKIVFPGRGGDIVGLTELKKLREHCKLREEDGVPRQSFYGNDDILSGFINRYRKILWRLGNK